MGKWAQYRRRGRVSGSGFPFPTPTVENIATSDEGGGNMLVHALGQPAEVFFFRARTSQSESGPWDESIIIAIGDPAEFAGRTPGAWLVQIAWFTLELQQGSAWSPSKTQVMA